MSPAETYHKIMNWRKYLIFSPELPPISREAEDLIRRFLCDAEERIGKTLDEIKAHPFFKTTDWEHIRCVCVVCVCVCVCVCGVCGVCGVVCMHTCVCIHVCAYLCGLCVLCVVWVCLCVGILITAFA